MRKRVLSLPLVVAILWGVSAAPGVAARIPAVTPVVRAAGLDVDRYREITIPAGTRLSVRLSSPVSSSGSRVEDPVNATLVAPVWIDRVEVLPAGSHVEGLVVDARRSGKVKGRARLALRFRTVRVRSGESYPIAASYSRVAPATKARDAEKIGIPAAGGALIGGLIGGKKGAAAGAAIGGGAGTAVVLSTRGKDVWLPRGSVLSLRIQRAVTVRVPMRS